MPPDAVIDRRFWIDFHSHCNQVHVVFASSDFVFLSKLYTHAFRHFDSEVRGARTGEVSHVVSAPTAEVLARLKRSRKVWNR